MSRKKYEHADAETVSFTMGQLREWASQCDSVRTWMNANIGHLEIFKEKARLPAKGDVYRMGEDYLMITSAKTGFWNITVLSGQQGSPGNRFGDMIGSLDHLGRTLDEYGAVFQFNLSQRELAAAIRRIKEDREQSLANIPL